MAGVRRRTKYRKSTLKSVTDELPEPAEDEYIAMALGSRGSNIFEIRLPDNTDGLCMLPTKYRKLVWIKRGMFLIVSGDPDAKIETASGKEGRVKYIVQHILLEEQEKHLRSTTHWPELFIDKDKKVEEDHDTEKKEDEEDDYMAGVFRNNNRRRGFDSDESSSEESSSEEDDS